METIYHAVTRFNSPGRTLLVEDTSKTAQAVAAAQEADYVVLVVSNAKDGGGEGQDRYTIALSKDQITFAAAVLAVCCFRQ